MKKNLLLHWITAAWNPELEGAGVRNVHSEKVPIQRFVGLREEDQYQPNLSGPALFGTPATEKDLNR